MSSLAAATCYNEFTAEKKYCFWLLFFFFFFSLTFCKCSFTRTVWFSHWWPEVVAPRRWMKTLQLCMHNLFLSANCNIAAGLFRLGATLQQQHSTETPSRCPVRSVGRWQMENLGYIFKDVCVSQATWPDDPLMSAVTMSSAGSSNVSIEHRVHVAEGRNSLTGWLEIFCRQSEDCIKWRRLTLGAKKSLCPTHSAVNETVWARVRGSAWGTVCVQQYERWHTCTRQEMAWIVRSQKEKEVRNGGGWLFCFKTASGYFRIWMVGNVFIVFNVLFMADLYFVVCFVFFKKKRRSVKYSDFQ